MDHIQPARLLCPWDSPGKSTGGGLVAKSCPTLATPWTVARQAPLSMEFSRQDYWIGLPFPPPGDSLNTGIKPGSLTLQADSSSELPGKPSHLKTLSFSLRCLPSFPFPPYLLVENLYFRSSLNIQVWIYNLSTLGSKLGTL